MANFPTVRVAAVQAAPVYLNLDATIEKTCKLVAEAATQGAKVVAFPEAFIPGYPYWIWMGTFSSGMKHYIQLYKNAVEIPSRAVQKLSEAAKTNKVYLCVSVTEKENASLYLTQLWFDPNGNLIGKHRKFKATNYEKTIWGDGDGSMAPVFKTEYGNLGGLMCWEHFLPLNVAAMGSLNEQIHVAAWPAGLPYEGTLLHRDVVFILTQFYAISNQCYCLMASNIYTDEMRDMIAEDDQQRAMFANGWGSTGIVAPNGKIIASVPRDEEGIAIADVDLSVIISGKYLADPSGHYSTPGFLSLTFDQNEHMPVKKIGKQTNHFISYETMQEVE